MTTFVLCHGAWGGGWGYVRVARILRAAGHDVFVPTYTGLGERVHLATPEVDLDTHITDVRNLIKYERLDDFVLVGHSYGGMVITGVADKDWKKIRKIVYLDAFLPQDGQSLADLAGPQATAGLQKAADQFGDGWRAPRPPGSISPDLSDEDKAWVEAYGCMQPIKTMTQKLPLAGNHLRIDEKAYVLAAAYKGSPFHQFADKLRKEPGWKYYEIDCYHHLLQSRPQETADILMNGV